MAIVVLDQLTKHYGKSRGITDISFSIEEGEVFGFIGPNGAGKSTTIRTLLNLIYPTSGSAEIFDKDCVKHTKEIRRQIGYLPSEVHYYDDMKVIDLLEYSNQFYGKNNKERLRVLAKRLDLDLARKIEDLSFGNRKKVGIVQALLHEPKLLILDEPTGGLDPLMQNVFFELLAEERKKGVTIFFSSHILSEVQMMCDRVAIIRQGELVQVETIENLTKRSFKKVVLTFDDTASPELGLDGIIEQQTQGSEVKILYSGDIKALLAKVQELPFKDIRIEEPSLEEIFMHYYEG
jgi:ABC-2 type transport system ATP-binding protein